MPRCEDYPCCGHVENGQSYCPDEEGRFSCADCGAKLPKDYNSSLCQRCINRMDQDHEDRNYDYD